MKKFFLSLLLVILCVAATVVFSAGATPPEDLNAVYADAVKMTADGIFSGGGTVSANCPACGKAVSWEPLSAISGTTVPHIKTEKHYYLSGDLSNKIYYSFESKVCLHLNGHNIKSSARAMYVETGAKLSIMGDGTVSGVGLSHSTCDRGGALDIAGTVNLYGGTYKHTGDYPVIASRGSKGGINMYEGTRVTGTSGHNGSNVRVYVSYLNMYGGTIENGIGTQGGNIMGTKNAKINIAGGTVTGGTVYMAADSASLTLSGSPKVDVINLFDGPQADISGLTEGADIQIVGQGIITQANDNMDALSQYLRSPNELVKLSVKDGAVYGTVDTTGDSDAPLCDGKTLKILCLTSSFGLNTTELLYDIAVAEGIEDVTVARLYASGCTLKKHVDSYNNDTGIYWYTKFTDEGKVSVYDAKLLDGLLDEDWDIIYIQQGAEQTPQLHTYEDYLDQFMEIIHANKTNPNAKFIWNQTWAFQWDNPRKIFTDTFQGNQLLMHEAIIDAMQEKILTRSDFCALIPTGAAVQNARTSYFGDRLTKDTLHLNNLGRIIGGYTVLATVLDKDITEVNVGSVKSYDLTTPIRISETDRQVIMESVNNARKDPFRVYQSKFTPEYLNGIGAKAAALSFTAGDTTALCPYCEKEVLWKPLSNSSATALQVTDGNWGHYYLAEDLTISTSYFHLPTQTGHTGYCLHLNGHNIKNTGKRAFWVGPGNTLNIMGSGTVSGIGEGSKEADWRAAALDVNGIVNLFGGTYTNDAARPAVMMRATEARVNLFDGATIQGNTDHSTSAIFIRVAGPEFNMFGGTVEGGKAANGGSIRITAKATFNMFGGTMQGGQSTSIGGNVYATNGTINMYGGTICGGYVTNSSSSYGRGGNVALNGSSTAKPAFYMYGGVIGSETVTGEAAGYASAGGANLYVANGTADILGENAVISGGYGENYGGNIMVSSNAYVTLTKGTVKNGRSVRGGNVYLAGTTSHFTQNGGTLANGTAAESGGNAYVNNGYFIFAGGTSQGGTAPTGSNLHLKTGKALADNYALIHHDAAVSETAPVISGGTIYCEYAVTLGTFTTENASFSFAESAAVTVENGLDLNNAKFAGNPVDLAGHSASISGSGNITGFDSANEDFKTFGSLTLTGITLNNPGLSTVSGKDYYALEENGSYSFHRLEMAITGASLRPSTAGIYFTGAWTCDDALAAKIDSFGVAVSLHNMPGADFMADPEEDNMWSSFAGSQFQSGEPRNGIMIDGILKQADESRVLMNPIYAKMPISAVAYLVIDGQTLASDGVAMSLHDILSAVTEVPAYTEALQNFLAAWKPYGLSGADWEF